jgi:formate hydrogenlyase subunit 3/multisubunit Na+/H+ antiporter MnhD subunit
MWLEIAIGWFIVLCILFMAFYIPMEGTHWQKHKHLGPFARFVQKSPSRSFFTFLVLMISMSMSAILIVHGYWLDTILAGNLISSTVPVVTSLLLFFLILSLVTPILWGRFRIWRQALRASSSEDRTQTIFTKTLDEFAEEEDITAKDAEE